MREILLVAGETSGDTHAARVALELRKSAPRYRLTGIGGNLMRDAGVELIEHVGKLAVMGFTEVIRHVPRHWSLLRNLRRRIESGQVALVILIDYPGFNMKVARAARRAGVPVLYYITPQVWAWGERRIRELSRTVDRAAVILPFEEDLLRAGGVDATFVGHPLLDRILDLPTREEARAALGVDPHRPLLALFPGSRPQELERHLDAFVNTARELEQRRPELQVLVSGTANAAIDPIRCPYRVVESVSLTVLRAADAAMCKSGTTTLEAAAIGCPLVVAYRTGAVTYAAARRLVRIPHIGLVNIVAGGEVAPEFVQGNLDPPRVTPVLERLLTPDSPERHAMVSALAKVRERLGTPGAAVRVAAMAASMIEQHPQAPIEEPAA